MLQGAAENGDTLLPFAETMNRITKRFPERRACRPDRDLVLGQASFYPRNRSTFVQKANPPTMAAPSGSPNWSGRSAIRLPSAARRPRTRLPRDGWSWEKLLLDEFGKKSGSTKLPPEVEDRARKEKAEALAKLYEGRFSVLCGRAGTGKTSVLEGFSLQGTGGT